MADTLNAAYHEIINLLPTDWILIGMIQDSGGWRVSVGKRTFDIEQSWETTLESRAGSLLKAMTRMIDKLEQM